MALAFAALVLGTRRGPAPADGVEQAARSLRPGAPPPAVPAVTRRDDTEEGLLLATLTLSAVQLRETEAALW
ncbi:hypothetical protein SUDANB15_00597 [Streptomyces sp. enrichment culture]|uniref:hypothetical protein n=1 Tax=Streptomyces sp. enrichment culture TaxID=1795815 RepID=UPI003F574D47